MIRKPIRQLTNDSALIMEKVTYDLRWRPYFFNDWVQARGCADQPPPPGPSAQGIQIPSSLAAASSVAIVSVAALLMDRLSSKIYRLTLPSRRLHCAQRYTILHCGTRHVPPPSFLPPGAAMFDLRFNGTVIVMVALLAALAAIFLAGPSDSGRRPPEVDRTVPSDGTLRHG